MDTRPPTDNGSVRKARSTRRLARLSPTEAERALRREIAEECFREMAHDVLGLLAEDGGRPDAAAILRSLARWMQKGG